MAVLVGMDSSDYYDGSGGPVPLGYELRRARVALGVTRCELAAMVGCSTSSLDKIEQGATPKRSRVLTDAIAALERLSAEAATAAPEHVQPRPAGPFSAGHDAPTPAAVPAAGVPSAAEGER